MSYLGQEILSTSWHLASSSSSYLRSLPPPNASRINLEHALPIQAAAAVVFTTTRIGSSETAGLRKWTLHGGKSRLARQAQKTSPSTSKPSTSAAVKYSLTYTLVLRRPATCHQRPHVTLSDLRHSFSFTPSQASFPLLRFKTPTDHVPREPDSQPARHSLRRFTPILHFRIALLRLGLSVA
jgi:hypothetical protein